MSDKLEKLVDELSTLSVLEAADLVKKLEEKWGVSPPRLWLWLLSLVPLLKLSKSKLNSM